MNCKDTPWAETVEHRARASFTDRVTTPIINSNNQIEVKDIMVTRVHSMDAILKPMEVGSKVQAACLAEVVAIKVVFRHFRDRELVWADHCSTR